MKTIKPSRLCLYAGTLAATLVTSACQTPPNIGNAQYWQRINVSETTYINGPKAQQMLNRDIARCVTELEELERLGQVKDPIPTNYRGRVLNPDELAMLSVDEPERDDNLFVEHTDYRDFESCMDEKGWERTNTVTYAVSERAKRNFYANHIEFKNKEDMTKIDVEDKDMSTLAPDPYND